MGRDRHRTAMRPVEPSEVQGCVSDEARLHFADRLNALCRRASRSARTTASTSQHVANPWVRTPLGLVMCRSIGACSMQLSDAKLLRCCSE
jgi:hypothetical protein